MWIVVNNYYKRSDRDKQARTEYQQHKKDLVTLSRYTKGL